MEVMFVPLLVALCFGIAIGIGLNRRFGAEHDHNFADQ